MSSKKYLARIETAKTVMDEMFPEHTDHSAEYYNMIIDNLEVPPKEHYEIHHYLPKYDGGKKETVRLVYRDHIKAHLLLALHYMEIGDTIRTKNNSAAVNACKKKSPARERKLSEMTPEDREELFKYYEESSRRVSIACSGENNPFYGKKHPPERIEEMMRIKGLVREGVGVLPQTLTPDRIKFRRFYGNYCKQDNGTMCVEVLRHADNRITRIHWKDFNEEEYSLIPWERRNEEVDLGRGIGKGRPGNQSERQKAARLRNNKNPVKIERMAAKHRGMKRSEESRERMRQAQKGHVSSVKGRVSYSEPETKQVFFFEPGQEVPSHLVKGNITTKRKQYYDPISGIMKRFYETDAIPDGWLPGCPPGRGKKKPIKE